MKLMRIGLPTALVVAIAGGLSSLIAGCDASHSGTYREYSQLENGDAPADSAAQDASREAGTSEPAAASPDAAAETRSMSDEGPITASARAETAEPTPEAQAKTQSVASVVDSPLADSELGTGSPASSAANPATQNSDSASAEPTPATAAEARDAAAGASATGVTTPAGPGAQVPAAAAKAEPAVPRKVELLVKDREFKVEGPEDALRVSYDDLDLLKVLNMEPVIAEAPHLMPDWLKNLDGRRIRIRGFMYPNMLETGIKQFVLARDNQICCFGRDPKLYDVFGVQMRNGETTDYILGRPFDVVGVFHIQPIIEEGEIYQLYAIDDAIVIQ